MRYAIINYREHGSIVRSKEICVREIVQECCTNSSPICLSRDENKDRCNRNIIARETTEITIHSMAFN